MTIEISVWSDIACPWCWIGKKRLATALDQFKSKGARIDADVTFRSFELDTRAKDAKDKTPYVQRLAKKYGVPVSRAQGMVDNMTQTGLPEGIAFDFENAIPANTFDAHRLLHWALRLDEKRRSGGAPNAIESLQSQLKEALMAAHFEQGIDLGSESGLLSVVDGLGLDVDAAAAVLASDAFAKDVREDEEEAQMLGVTGVPFYVIGRFGISGAQQPDTFVQTIQRALSEQAQAEREEREVAAALAEAEGDYCPPEGC